MSHLFCPGTLCVHFQAPLVCCFPIKCITLSLACAACQAQRGAVWEQPTAFGSGRKEFQDRRGGSTIISRVGCTTKKGPHHLVRVMTCRPPTTARTRLLPCKPSRPASHLMNRIMQPFFVVYHTLEGWRRSYFRRVFEQIRDCFSKQLMCIWLKCLTPLGISRNIPRLRSSLRDCADRSPIPLANAGGCGHGQRRRERSAQSRRERRSIWIFRTVPSRVSHFSPRSQLLRKIATGLLEEAVVSSKHALPTMLEAVRQVSSASAASVSLSIKPRNCLTRVHQLLRVVVTISIPQVCIHARQSQGRAQQNQPLTHPKDAHADMGKLQDGARR